MQENFRRISPLIFGYIYLEKGGTYIENREPGTTKIDTVKYLGSKSKKIRIQVS